MVAFNSPSKVALRAIALASEGLALKAFALQILRRHCRTLRISIFPGIGSTG
jgi:hypothetical protein